MERTSVAYADVTETRRVAIEMEGRRLLLVRHRDEVHAIDASCSHMGADLAGGDIEDLGGALCIRCPWHGKRFCISSGRELVQVDNRPQLSAEQKQRIHRVVVGDDGFLWIGVDNDPRREVASDRFCQGSSARLGAGQPAAAAGPAPPALAPFGDVLQRILLVPTVASSNSANVAEVVVVPPPPKVVAPAILPPLGAEFKLPSPPPAPRTGNGIMTASGFRARRQTATNAVASKLVRPPVVPRGADAPMSLQQADIRGFLGGNQEQPVARTLRFEQEAPKYGPLPMDVDF